MLNNRNVSEYFSSFLKEDKKRSTVWKYLYKYYFYKHIKLTDVVVEIGAGWCDFINQIVCKEKYASDIWPGVKKHANVDVNVFVTDAVDLSFLNNKKADVIIASNLLEHLTKSKVDEVINAILGTLSDDGKLVILQPNFRLNPSRYFDDYTHISIWSDISLRAYLEAKGFTITTYRPKFLPLTVKTKFPVFGFLIWIYLNFPFKFRPGQMLLIAQVKD